MALITPDALLARRLSFTVGSGFALALLLIGALTLVSMRQVAQTHAHMEAIANVHDVKTRMATSMRDILRDRAIAMLAISVVDDPFEKDAEMMRFFGYGSAYQKVRTELEAMINDASERAMLDKLDRLTRFNQPVMVRAVNAAMDNHTTEALDILKREALPLQVQLVGELDAFAQAQRARTLTATQAARDSFVATRRLILLLGVVAVLVAAAVAAVVVRRTARLTATIERERTKFQTLFETNTDGIAILDQRGFVDCNPATLAMFQFASKRDFIASQPGSLGQDPQPCGVAAAELAGQYLNEAAEKGHAFFHWIARRPDGDVFPMQIDLHAMTLDGRRVIQAIMRDISMQKETEDSLRRARDEALGATRMKSQFVANVSHEIRTPMNGILGMTQRLLGTPLDARQRDYADSIHGSAKALMGILNDLLDFSRMESGRFELEPGDFDLGELLRELMLLCAARAEAKRLTLRLSADTLADCRTCRRVYGDSLRLRQVLLNLLDNAIKFTEAGSVELALECLADQPERMRFEVRDTGIGMPPEVQARVFEAFAQADGSISRRFGGTGLGLAISRQLAELMGGTLDVRSEAGRGSRFILELPLPPARQPTAPEAPFCADPAPATLRLDNARVLAAEDNPVNSKLLDYMLQDHGIHARMVDNGRKAYDEIQRARQAGEAYDLVLMDVQMPLWDGLTATRALRADEQRLALPRLPVLGLTANAMPGFVETCLQAGMDAVLTKPLNDEDLRDMLTRWLPQIPASTPDAAPDASAPANDAPQPAPQPARPEEETAPDLYAAEQVRRICRQDPERIREMLALFISSTEPLLDALVRAAQENDAARTERNAHQLKGATAYIGARAMTQFAAEVERAARAGDWGACLSNVEELEAAFITLRLRIEDDLKALDA